MTRIALVAGLLSACLFATGYEARVEAQGQAAKLPDYNESVASSPEAMRNGMATLEQVSEFLGVNDDALHGQPIWELDQETDLDLDGTKDLLVSNHTIEGVGGHSYAVFLKTPKGYRFVGAFEGFIRTLPLEKGKPVRFIISGTTETAAMAVELAELQASGLHRLARAEMKTGGCDANDNPVYQELVCSEKGVSVETLKKAFPNLS